jgi:hypothetical protein
MPEPISGCHDELVHANPETGKPNFLNRRRPVLMQNRSGFIVAGFIYVQILIQDMTTLALLGVFEKTTMNNIVLVAMKEHLPTAVTCNAVQRPMIMASSGRR